jgi:putative chitinase
VASSDFDTLWLQKALNDLGADPPLTLDGLYGPGTTAAVKDFQKSAKIKVDGVAGEVTRAALRLRLNAR